MPNTADDGIESDYTVIVRQYTNEELLEKERRKRRRKTGDIVGTGLSAIAAVSQPALWTIAGANVKSYLSSASKHKIILKEMGRRGLEPLKENMSDTILPILSSAGGMYAGRALGGKTGEGVASMAGTLLNTVGTRALSGGLKSNKKEKEPKKKGKDQSAAPQLQRQGQTLATPSMYYVAPDQTPPATLVYNYVPPSAEYPRGYYAPAPVQPQALQAAPQPVPAVYQVPSMLQQGPPLPQQMPPFDYQHAQPQPQYYQYPQMGATGLQRAQTVYPTPLPYQLGPQRAQSMPYM